LNWRELNRKLSGMSEDEVKALLVAEMEGERRVVMLRRLHQRFTALRSDRERLELMELAASDTHPTRQ
jgi:hypothetical protein